jgi:hypothetical protein
MRRRATRLGARRREGCPQAAVQPYLFLAGVAPRLHGPKVEEAEIDGPLQLPDVIADQEDP